MKGKKKIIILGVVVVLISALVGVYFFMKYQTYDRVEFVKTYENKGTDNANYKKCLSGVLRYSRDGIALLSDEGDVVWNQPCQMNSPVVEMCGESVAVGDKGGTEIMVFHEKGLKGEIKTTRPIEKMTVSSQGIVAALLKDEEVPSVVCYDAKGNVLVEHKVSLKNIGYPTDVALAENGKTLIVSYLKTEGTEVVSKVTYFYFGDDDQTNDDYQIYEERFVDAVVPTVEYMNKDTSILVSDRGICFYKGTKKIKQSAMVELKGEIHSVGYDDKLVAVLMRKSATNSYVLMIYDTNGEMHASVEVEREYRNVHVIDNQVILFDGQSCSIYMKNGVHKYTGNLEENIVEMYPYGTFNKYMLINAGGFHEIELAK